VITAVLLALSVLSVIGVALAQNGVARDFTQLTLTMKNNWTIGSKAISGTFRNEGNQAISISLARAFIDIVPASFAGSCLTAILVPGETCEL